MGIEHWKQHASCLRRHAWSLSSSAHGHLQTDVPGGQPMQLWPTWQLWTGVCFSPSYFFRLSHFTRNFFAVFPTATATAQRALLIRQRWQHKVMICPRSFWANSVWSSLPCTSTSYLLKASIMMTPLDA